MFLFAVSVAIVAQDVKNAVLLPGFFLAPLLVIYLIWWRKFRHEIPIDLVLRNFGERERNVFGGVSSLSCWLRQDG